MWENSEQLKPPHLSLSNDVVEAMVVCTGL